MGGLVGGRGLGGQLQLMRDCSVLQRSRAEVQILAEGGVLGGVEGYRVRLPINFESMRGVILGEGKPENQNHTIIFCKGETVQTIDCNQDNMLSEALKLPNLLSEFAKPGKDKTALVGFREWVFSEDSGALAEFAAATERSFGTTVQRVMHKPAGVRMHYGHPDVWRRSFVATCGGVSKANRGLHVSEDVFGGYNVLLRGYHIQFVDYIAVGKGRDMGLESINTFEGKIAAGNGEQVLSREVRRLGQRLDFCRLLTWYHTGSGFFINTALTMLSVLAMVWTVLLMSILGQVSEGAALTAYLGSVQLLQLGTLSVLVFWFTMALDHGVIAATWTIVRQVIQGSLMFYIFRAQTTASGFVSDLLFGGAKYAATGRGYKLAPTSFTSLYERYGRSHMYFGVVLLEYCIAALMAQRSAAGFWSLWAPLLVAASMLFGPFWFTPLAFRTKLVMEDARQHQHWMLSSADNRSWWSWNKAQRAAQRDTAGRQMGRFSKALCADLYHLIPQAVLVLAVGSRLAVDSELPLSLGRIPNFPKIVWFVILLALWVLPAFGLMATQAAAKRGAMHHRYRLLSILLTGVLLVGVLLSAAISTERTAAGADREAEANLLDSYTNVLWTMFAAQLLLRLLPLLNYLPSGLKVLWVLVDWTYYLADLLLAMLLTGLRFILSFGDILTAVQQQLLFNSQYAAQVLQGEDLAATQVPRLLRELLRIKKTAREQERLRGEKGVKRD